MALQVEIFTFCNPGRDFLESFIYTRLENFAVNS